MRSASWPGSVTLSTSAAGLLGQLGHELDDPLGDVLQVHHQRVELDVGRSSDRASPARAAMMNGSCWLYSAMRMRETPCRMTQKLSLASLMTLRMRAAQPT